MEAWQAAAAIHRRQAILAGKLSAGIAMFRQSADRVQVLLVRRRLTQAFRALVLGHENVASMAHLAQRVTREEAAILALYNFAAAYARLRGINYHAAESQLRVAPRQPPTSHTRRLLSLRKRFDRNLRSVHRELEHAPFGRIPWELPHGSIDRGETTAQGAVREFTEETKGTLTRIQLDIRSEIVDREYRCVYYAAVSDGAIKDREHSVFAEISEVRWVDINDAALLVDEPTRNVICELVRKLRSVRRLV
jgi:ADP-ribose pyrophosphatase YjhB (NUDIX family)